MSTVNASSLFHPELFNAAAKRLRTNMIIYWRHDSINNHNRIVSDINAMVRHATFYGTDETAARNTFDRITIDLERLGYKGCIEMEFKDFRQYLDEEGNPYE